MWTFLGLLLMVSMVSGDDVSTTVRGFVNESVLLPCNCSNVRLKANFSWQKEETNKIHAFIGFQGNSTIDDTYKGRVTLFQDESKTNCSFQLHNITVADQGTYRCSVWSSVYVYCLVHLNISENPEGRPAPALSLEAPTPSLEVQSNPPRRLRIYIIIPIGFAVVLSLFFFHHRKPAGQNTEHPKTSPLETC